MTKKHTGFALLAAAVALEWSHMQVTKGTTATGTMASIQGQLANLDEITGATLHLSYILGAIGLYLVFKG